MGRDVSLALARQGARVVLAARTLSMLEEVAEEVRQLGGQAAFQPTDITSEPDCQRLAQLAVEAFGRSDILVNNAFVQPPFETIEQASLETWDRAIDVNLLGALRMSRAVVPQMKRQGGGSVVFVNSMSIRRTQPYFGVYAATKFALLSLARTMAKELGQSGIRVNSIVPGYIWGSSVEWYFGELAKREGCTPQEVYDRVASETCLGHLPTSEEIADVVLFLASDLSRAVTGQALDVNAGHWFE